MSHLGEVPIRRRVWLTSTGGDPRTAIQAGTQSHTRARSLYIGPHVPHCCAWVPLMHGCHMDGCHVPHCCIARAWVPHLALTRCMGATLRNSWVPRSPLHHCPWVPRSPLHHCHSDHGCHTSHWRIVAMGATCHDVTLAGDVLYARVPHKALMYCDGFSQRAPG